MGDKNIHPKKIGGEVLRQMYDVRPVTKDGSLDLERIRMTEKYARIAPDRKRPGTKDRALILRQGCSAYKHKDEGEKKRSVPSQCFIYEPTGARSAQNDRPVFVDVRKAAIPDQKALRFQGTIEKDRPSKGSSKPKISNFEIEVVDHEIDNVGTVAVKFASAGLIKNPTQSQRIQNSQKYEIKKTRNAIPAKKASIAIEDYSKKPIRSRMRRVIRKLSTPFLTFFEFYLAPLRYSCAPGRRKLPIWRQALSFSAASLAIFVIIFSINFASLGLKIKNEALIKGQDAYASLNTAKEGISDRDFKKSSASFEEAYQHLDEISRDVDSLGGILVEATKYLPYISKLSSGSHLAKAGKDLSRVGVLSSEIMATLNDIKNPLAENNQKESVSYLEIFKNIDGNIKESADLIKDARVNLEDVNLEDIPDDKRSGFIALKQKIPQIENYLSEFLSEDKIFTDILGGNGPRKYLFLFQNNQEMRPTGGFIGTYALLDIFNGRVDNFKVDGIFNPDGQLRERVVPPGPIQKISAAWSLHDSNWFPNFPTSAEKAAWFFEKTGGPTVDGVITMTPVVMQKLLEVTGPIEMPEYDVTVDKDNFLEQIQYEVEVDYDKDLNQPKKILADLAPKILDRIFNAKNIKDVARTMAILAENLNERHILLYSKNWEIEKIISQKGWSGEMLETRKDYLSVINTNINGFKTDGVIDEKIFHKAELQLDGSIIDTVTIRRHHNGGDTQFEWWNKVNADYMRIYVPKGSKLISVEGQTREFNQPPLDYDALGYKRDAQVEMEEDSVTIDEESGTRIYEDAGKTVFANWTYVSPKETVEVKYVYLLPFRVEIDARKKPVDTYSILFQKQSGSIGSQIESEITYPSEYNPVWKYPDENVSSADDLPDGRSGIMMENKLELDKFFGIAFKKD